MFDNIGSKLKSVAKTYAWVGIILFGIVGLITMFANPDTPIPGILVIAIGCGSSYASSLVLYGFGQIVENTDKLVATPSEKNISSLNDIESNLPQM